MLPAALGSKPVPEMTTAVPTGPLVGFRPEIDGAPVPAASTVNDRAAEVPERVETVTCWTPAGVPAATWQTISVVVEERTLACVAPKKTVLRARSVSKFVPAIVTAWP